MFGVLIGFIAYVALREAAPSEPLCPGRDEVERRHLPLKRFVFGVMNILNDPVCAGPTPPGVKVLEKGQCYACDAFGVSNLTN